MDSNLSYFNLPFVDAGDLDFGKIRGQECEYDDLNPTLPSNVSLLGADDDVLAQFLSGDDPLEDLGRADLNGPTTLHCEICKKQFDNAKKYYGHLRVHSKDNLWICDKCPEHKREKFSTKQQLMKHNLTHQPLGRVWKCPQCEMSFEALWRVQQHLFAKHLDYRPHKCDVCQKTFHKLSDLDKHKDIHDDTKKHVCTVCGSKFKDRSNLGRHMLTHGEIKPHICPGCGHRFKQIASLRRHTQSCPFVQKTQCEVKKTYRNNYCRVCGLTFQYKSSLLEHCVRAHSNDPEQAPLPPREDKSNQMHREDTNRTVDNIVDDILSAEDDYITMSTQHLNYPPVSQDNLMQMELMKEMNQMHNMHILDDELLYNDIDLDSFQTMCNNIERNELFDLNDKSIDHIMNGPLDHDLMNGRLDQEMNDRLDQDIMNGRLEQDLMNAIVRGIEQKDDMPKEFTPEMNSKVNEFLLNPPVSVNECATIFESDVDLEASTNLAANLNQLIGENTVQYISTEHDDTFIISLNSEIDAEQLTDMLNIGVDTKQETEKQPVSNEAVNDALNENKNVEPVKKKKCMYVCLICKKIFKTKNNYTSHRGTHNADLQRYECRICTSSFSYKSSLNKHIRNKHTPLVRTEHKCRLCGKTYPTEWQLKKHKNRDHKLLQPFRCDKEGCSKAFFMKSDLNKHSRHHSGEKPHKCEVCGKGFKISSHLARHVKFVHSAKKNKKCQNSKILTSPMVPSQNSKPTSNTTISGTPSSSTQIIFCNSIITANLNPMYAIVPSNSVITDNAIPNNHAVSKNVIPKSPETITNKVKTQRNRPKRAKSLLTTPQHLKIEQDKAKIAKALGIVPQNLKLQDVAKSLIVKPSHKESKNCRSLLRPPKKIKTQDNNIKVPQNLKIQVNEIKPGQKRPQLLKIEEIKVTNPQNVILKPNNLKVANYTLLITPLQRKITKPKSLLLRTK